MKITKLHIQFYYEQSIKRTKELGKDISEWLKSVPNPLDYIYLEDEILMERIRDKMAQQMEQEIPQDVKTKTIKQAVENHPDADNAMQLANELQGDKK